MSFTTFASIVSLPDREPDKRAAQPIPVLAAPYRRVVGAAVRHLPKPRSCLPPPPAGGVAIDQGPAGIGNGVAAAHARPAAQ